MTRNTPLDLLPGAAVILIAAAFFAFMHWQTGTANLSAYAISAELGRADRLDIGTEVRIAGVPIGKITGLSLEPHTYKVEAQLSIKTGIAIPADSKILVSSGVMSSPYLTIQPGYSTAMIPPGGILKNP
jgi:phospholipid/cholesterol/gamma-HCH transport system substrate-binding protein